MEIKSIDNKPKGSRFLKFIMAHKMVFFLLLLLLVVLLWAAIKMNVMERRFVSEKEKLIIKYDSLAISNMELTAKVFSWAIRSEMTRENREQVNQFFLNFIKEPNVSKVYLIDALTSKIILSTDKKDEGVLIEDSDLINAENTHLLKDADSVLTIVAPVMGLNNRIGVLVIERKKDFVNP